MIGAASHLARAMAAEAVSKGSALATVSELPTGNASVRGGESLVRWPNRPAHYSQPTSNETLSREPAVAALHPWETGVLDIANCERTEFVVALKDGETAGTRMETWPPEVQAFMDQHVTRWVEENKQTRTVRAMTVAAPKYHGIHHAS